jgi:formiminotetrahydrofolate cyclodeaminase
VVGSADAAPPSQTRQAFEDISSRVDTQLQQLREVIDTDVAAFNKLISEASVPAIVPTAQA